MNIPIHSSIYFSFSEEWQWLQRLGRNDVSAPPTPAQRQFHALLDSATKKFLTKLHISEDAAVSHRLYDVEVRIEQCIQYEGFKVSSV